VLKAFYTDIFELPLPPGHRFPMAKYRMLRERVEGLAIEGLAGLRLPRAADDAMLRRVHDESYLQRVKTGTLSASEVRQLGFPWSDGLVERSRRSVGATVDAALAALDDGIGVNLAGGTHHAFADRGRGFCVFNDAVVAARALQAEGWARRVLILDLDVHQGDGTAALTREDERLFSCSLHGDKNYPFRKEVGDLDVALPDGTDDDSYLPLLANALDESFARFEPDLCIYLAGADPHEGDRLGRMKLTMAGLRQRDEMVFETCRHRGLPVAVAMAGGYGHDIATTVDVHFQTVRLAAQMVRRNKVGHVSAVTRE